MVSNKKNITSFIISALRNFKFPVVVMFFVAILWAADLSLRPYVLKIIINRVSEASNQDILASAAMPIIIYFLMTLSMTIIFRFYDYFVNIKMIPNLRRNIANLSFSHLLKQSYSYYQNNFAGSLTNKVNDLSGYVPDILQIGIDKIFAHGLAVVIAVIILWQVNGLFALGMFAWIAICVLGIYFFSKKLISCAINWSECGSAITGRLVDSLSNSLAVRLFAKSKEEAAILAKNFDDATLAEQKLQQLYFWMWTCIGFSFVLMQGINLYFLIKGKMEGWITAGDFVVVLGINFSIVDLLWNLSRDFTTLSEALGRVSQALRIIYVSPEIKDKANAKEMIVKNGEIVFDNVKFHYKGSTPLFNNKSVTIKPGQKVGLVGYSGSGKTTFVNLILRIYDLSQGKILIDLQDIAKVTQNSLRENIGMIPQEPTLFHRTLMENIRYAKMDATDEEVIEAVKKAHAYEFIKKLPEGFDAMVGERGVKLSGGQRQRIAIARAFLKNAPILMLDEATSQLDSVTESEIQESLWELMQNKTTLVVAHRLSTLLHMNRILVFDKGKIIEDGSHEELLEQNGLYKTLWNTQIGGMLIDGKHS